MKKQKILYLSICIMCFIGSLVSVFFPYLERHDIPSEHPIYSPFAFGYDYMFAVFSLLFMAITVMIAAFTESSRWTISFCILTLGMVYLTRFSIHFQGFIDHDYDSKTGVGFLLIFIFSITLFVASAIYWGTEYFTKKRNP